MVSKCQCEIVRDKAEVVFLHVYGRLEVHLGLGISDHLRVTIKIISMRMTMPKLTGVANNSSVLNKMKILQLVRHPCLINLDGVIDNANLLYIVLQFAQGGEVFDKIINKTKPSEDETTLYFYQTISAIQYLQ